MADLIADAVVQVAGKDVNKTELGPIIVEMDVDQPDMCSVVVNNTADSKYSKTAKLGDEIKVTIGATGNPENRGSGASDALFTGELVGIEPIYDVAGETKVVLRAFHKLHRCTRVRKSKTYVEQSDPDIAKAVLSEFGLQVTADSSSLKHKHVYQHDLTALEFLLQRARRINFEILCDGAAKVKFRKRGVGTDSGIKLKFGKDGQLQVWKPRLSSANQVGTVTVRGWDSLKSEVINGQGNSLEATLGASSGYSKSQTAFGDLTAAYELPVYSKEEADALAKSLFEDHAMGYIVGEGQVKGDPTLRAGQLVTIEGDDERFDGKYYITGVTHRYTQKGGPSGGYLTFIRFRRNAEGK